MANGKKSRSWCSGQIWLLFSSNLFLSPTNSDVRGGYQQICDMVLIYLQLYLERSFEVKAILYLHGRSCLEINALSNF